MARPNVQRSNNASREKLRTLAAAGVFSALAYICCVLFHFKASFLSFDLKDSVMAIGAMFFGPACGFAMSLLVSTIELVTISSTGIYGYIMNLLSSIVFVCVGSFVYSRKRDMTGALIGMLLSVVSVVAVMLGANLVITPYYMHVSVEDVRSMLLPLLLPFNLTKAVFNASLVFLLYKPVSTALKASGFIGGKGGTGGVARATDKRGGLRSMTMLVVPTAVIVCVLALLFFFLYLQGSFELA